MRCRLKMRFLCIWANLFVVVVQSHQQTVFLVLGASCMLGMWNCGIFCCGLFLWIVQTEWTPMTISTPKMMMSHIWPTNFSLLKGFCSVVYIWPSSLMSTITMPFLSFQNSCSDAQEWRVKHSSDRALGTVNCSGPPLMDNSVQRWWWWLLWVNPGVEIVVWALVNCVQRELNWLSGPLL